MALKHKGFWTAMLLLVAFPSFSQINSPYTRFGLGSLQSPLYAINRSMGGISAAYGSLFNINPNNPASYGYFYKEIYTTYYEKVKRDTTYFDETLGKEVTRKYVDSVRHDTLFYVFKASSLQTGVYADFRFPRNAQTTNPSGDASLSYLAFGFPIPKFGGMSVGLVPYSVVNYNITTSIEKDTLIGPENNIFTGSGRLYKFYFGTGGKWKGFSAGINGAYLFGTLINTRINYFPEQSNSFGTRVETITSVGGLTWNAGLQYEHQISPGVMLRVGAAGNTTTRIRVSSDTLKDRILVRTNDKYTHIDSMGTSLNNRGTLTVPASITGGLAIQNGDHWLVGSDFIFARWGDSPGLLAAYPQHNSWRWSIGGAYRPALTLEETRFLRTITYRAGFYYGQNNLIINNNPLNEFGISFGLGIPVRQKLPRSPLASSLNFAFEFGNQGNISDNLIKENFFKFTLGLNLNDNFWIFKTKFK